MNTATPTSQDPAERFARRVTARLEQGSHDLPYDISERLRASRMQALSKRKVTAPVLRAATAVQAQGNGTAVIGNGGSGGWRWWNALVSAVPLIALVVGLVVIDGLQDEWGINEVAEVDAALLTDDLPPAAYADAGFLEFLKTAQRAPSQ